jgi:hypothetical protein
MRRLVRHGQCRHCRRDAGQRRRAWPCAAADVAATMEAGTRTKSVVIVNGSDMRGSRRRDEHWVARGALSTQEIQMRDAVATGGNALPKDDPADVTRIEPAAARRLQAHRWRKRMGLRCLTVRVSDREVRHLISTGYLSLESSNSAPMVAIALEAWIYNNLP